MPPQPQPPPPAPGVALGAAALTLVVLLVVAFPFAAAVAVQARRRGYGFLAWLVGGTLGNPVFFLVLLALMPDLARRALRRKEMADLEAKLAGRPRTLPPPPGPAAAVPSTLSGDRSVGDLPTALPPDRSLGDDATML
jgi:hypothetical protein